MNLLISTAVLIAVCIGGAVVLLRCTPDSWTHLDVKVGFLQLQASRSDNDDRD